MQSRKKNILFLRSKACLFRVGQRFLRSKSQNSISDFDLNNLERPFYWRISKNYTAIPYRVSTGPEQGFPCVVFPNRGKPVFSSWDPCNENRVFPVGNTTQGKHFLYSNKTSNIIWKFNDNFSEGLFEVLHISVGQEIKILETRPDFLTFSAKTQNRF